MGWVFFEKLVLLPVSQFPISTVRDNITFLPLRKTAEIRSFVSVKHPHYSGKYHRRDHKKIHSSIFSARSRLPAVNSGSGHT